MDYLVSAIWGTSLSLMAGSVLIFLSRNWLLTRLTESIKRENSKAVFKDKEVWLMKRKACLQALKLANAVISNQRYRGMKTSVRPQYMKIEEIRETVDSLIVSCENGQVLGLLKTILFEDVGPDKIVDLRNAIRKELGFSKQVIDSDRERAFIADVNCLPRVVRKAR